MQFPKQTLVTIFVLLLALVVTTPVKPCGGTSVPFCGRTIWLALMAQRNVLLQPNVPIEVQFRYLAYLAWNKNTVCAQPAGASGSDGATLPAFSNANLIYTVTCRPIDNGPPVMFGPFTQDLNTPVTPGLQQPDSVGFTIPASSFGDAATPVICEISATFSADFGSGTGSGTISASNQTVICLAPPAPDDDTKPRLDLQYYSTSGPDDFVQRCRRGDQTYFYFLARNNDLRNSVTLDLSTELDPRSGLPNGFDAAQPQQNFEANVYAIQLPQGDFYPHQIVSNPATWDDLAEGDPQSNPAGLTQGLTLRPGEARFIVVCVRSFGKCGAGSCNKLTVRLDGTFSDGSPALACASSALLVDDVAGKSRRCELQDVVKVSPFAGAFWTAALYFDDQLQPIPHAQTHFAGNANPSLGRNLTFQSGGDTLSDNIRVDPTVKLFAAAYNVSASNSFLGTTLNLVAIEGLPSEVNTSKQVPVIYAEAADTLQVIINCEKDSIRIKNGGGEILHEGSYATFLQSTTPGFAIDENTCRTFTKVAVPDLPEICANVYFLAPNLTAGMGERKQIVEIFDQNRNPLPGTVTVVGPVADFINLPSNSFNGQFTFDIAADLPNAPDLAVGAFLVSSPGAVNQLPIPILLTEMTRLTLTATNEQELLSAFNIATERGGHTDIRIPTAGPIVITNLDLRQDGPAGDFITIEGDIQLRQATRSYRGDALNRMSAADVIIDGSGCPAPCNIFNIVGNHNSIRNLRFQNFPDIAVAMEGDSSTIFHNEFVDNGAGGVRISGNGNRIGGSPEQANHFSGNAGPGLLIESGTGNAALFNTFVNNDSLAIDLGGDGVTENDPADADSGANNLQNFPELSDAQPLSEGGTLITGMLTSAPDATFTLQFFANTDCHASGHGEGERLLGAAEINTDGAGEASFSVTVAGVVASGEFVTATATDAAGNTSEFSTCLDVIPAAVDGRDNLPTEFALHQNYPNPFNPGTTIRFDLPRTLSVKIKLYDVLGREVMTILDTKRRAGHHKVEFDGAGLASGIYFYRLETEGFVRTRKLTLLK